MRKRHSGPVKKQSMPISAMRPDPRPGSAHSEQLDEREQRLFRSLRSNGNDFVTRRDLVQALQGVGLLLGDARLRDCMSALTTFEETTAIRDAEFCRIIRPNILLIERALQGNLVIADFQGFCRDLQDIYEEVRGSKKARSLAIFRSSPA